MATFTHPGSRADLLLTLARLALPDAVRRAEQSAALTALLAVAILALATVATLGLFPLIFAIESDALRRNLLSLIFCSVTAFALLGQIVFRTPITWLLDLEDFLRLPVGFKDLYGVRFVLSTVGFWLPVFGPACAYLIATRSGGASGAAVTLLAMLSLIWIFGRTAAILSLFADRWVERGLGTAAMTALVAAAYAAFFAGAGALAGDFATEGVARAIEESAVLGGLSYTPPGIVAAMVHEPGWSARNLARLGGLFATLGVLTALENRLILRSYLERPGGDRRTGPGNLPVATTLRKAKSLTPMGTLTLLETECLLRLKPARLLLAMTVGFALASVPIFAAGAPLAGVFALVVHDLRLGKQPPTCHVWRESLTLPLAVERLFRATTRATSVVIILLFALILGLTPFDWLGWPFFFVALCLMLSAFLLMATGSDLAQLRWPRRSAGFLHDPDGARLAAAVGLAFFGFAPLPFSLLLYGLHEQQRVSSLTAGLIAISVLLFAVAAACVVRRRQSRSLETRGRELLLQDPSHHD